MNQPQEFEYPDWGKDYIHLVEGEVIEVLSKQATEFPVFLNTIINKADYSYAPEKWTIKQVVGHLIDTERIFAYRLLCFSRGESAPLPGFEENDYVENARFNDLNLPDLAEEFTLTRKSNLCLIKTLNEQELNRLGTASGRRMSARAIVFAMAGHVIHHINIINERYL
ncbi:MAG: DinB family protein [Pedobacter sp.]|nr:MAG: DinB family protein [Pedobacter sp.]